jgi:hypothetical protein
MLVFLCLLVFAMVMAAPGAGLAEFTHLTQVTTKSPHPHLSTDHA